MESATEAEEIGRVSGTAFGVRFARERERGFFNRYFALGDDFRLVACVPLTGPPYRGTPAHGLPMVAAHYDSNPFLKYRREIDELGLLIGVEFSPHAHWPYRGAPRRLPDGTLAFGASFPANVIATARAHGRGGFVAAVDVGPVSYVSDADAPHYGKTGEEACEGVKPWLLDDLACAGRLGKPHYQPHWDAYDIQYRLGEHWRAKLARMANEEVVGMRIGADDVDPAPI